MANRESGKDSIEGMMQDLREAVDQADTRIKEWQRNLAPGMFFVSIQRDTTVYGEILDPVRAAYEDERESIEELYASPHMQGFRFAECFSEGCPDGERGDIHVSTVTGILTPEQFEGARFLGWPDLIEPSNMPGPEDLQ